MRSNKNDVCVRLAGAVAALGVLAFALACGGSGSGTSKSTGGNNNQVIASPGPNVVTLTSDSGPTGTFTNGSFVTATICVPGTSTCQPIDHLLVDTGSFGLRILHQSGGGELTLALPQEKDGSNNPIGECVQFLDTSFLWGPVMTADVTLSSETASAMPVHVVGDTNFTGVPASCSAGGIDRDTLQQLGANGILGVGSFQYDCGPVTTNGCVPGSQPSPLPGTYYTCPNSVCTPAFAQLAQQVQNPVALFTTDNNGVIVELPSVPSGGAPSITGALVFGIGTQSNNSLGTATVQTLNGHLNLTATFKNIQYPGSFVDSGSNGIYFLDSTTTGLQTCPGNSFFYCPSSTQNFSATNTGQNSASTTINFSIADAAGLSSTNFVFNDLGGPQSGAFDWGLPFFLGRNVFVSIAGKSAPGGTTPYVAY
jgi:hypothetical protein